MCHGRLKTNPRGLFGPVLVSHWDIGRKSIKHCWCTIGTMSVLTVQCCKCDQCGHVWYSPRLLPRRCAKCKSMRWNSGTKSDDDGRGPRSAAPSEDQRSGNRTTVPVVPPAASDPQRLHPLQSVRRELARPGDAPTQLPQPGPPSSQKGSCPHGNRNQIVCRYISGGC